MARADVKDETKRCVSRRERQHSVPQCIRAQALAVRRAANVPRRHRRYRTLGAFFGDPFEQAHILIIRERAKKIEICAGELVARRMSDLHKRSLYNYVVLRQANLGVQHLLLCTHAMYIYDAFLSLAFALP